MAHKYDVIGEDLKNRMSSIIFSFSPENLTCDGELTQREVQSKVNGLSAQWWVLVDEALSLHKINVDFNEFEEYLYSNI